MKGSIRNARYGTRACPRVFPCKAGLPGEVEGEAYPRAGRGARRTGPSVRLVLPAVFLLLAAASCGDSAPEPGQACQDVLPSSLALWSEFLSPAEVREQVPRLKRHGLSLYQNIRSRQIGDPQGGQLLSAAACQGLEVRAWLTLPEDQGYWPNEKNVDLFAEAALSLAAWLRASGRPAEWIVVDMEPDLQMMEALTALLEAGDVGGAVDLLVSNHDPAAYARAAAGYTSLVETLHDMGFKVMVVTFPLVLDDLDDGDSTVQDVLNTPVHGIPWDELSFMAYTSIFSGTLSREVGPYLVSSYGQDAVARYPGRAALDLGVFGSAGMTEGEGITDIETFRAQVGAAKRAGLERIHAYSLDGIVTDMADPDLWMEAFRGPAAAEPVPTEPIVDAFRAVIQLIDRLVTDAPP